ncbi:MAG: WYL domain-containing protein [Desulfuromonas sp.]|nr:WYL domain-containing protein [Desulfuromonas sp.]
METLLRHWNMLRMVPRHPRKITTAELEERLSGRGYPTSRRTIQRDLDQLSREFPLGCDGHKPAGWSWQPDAEAFDVPGMDTTAALTFRMVETFLAPMLPPACVAALGPHLQRARNVLEQAHDGAQSHWPEKVAMFSRQQPLLAPEIAGDVLETVYEALFRDLRFTGTYHSRSEAEPLDCVVNPLGLILADPVIYLAGTLWDYRDVRLFALHRFESAGLLDEPARRPRGFKLNDYLRQGAIGIPVQPAPKSIRLRFLIEAGTGTHLLESPLSAEQRAEWHHDGRLLIEASVPDTRQLRWWLLGFGAKVEVLAPKSLREEFARSAQEMAGIYDGSSTS